MKKYLLIAILFLFAFTKVSTQTTISGEEYKNAVISSIDILSAHMQILRAQNQYENALSYFSMTYRTAPANFKINDGSTRNGTITRFLFPLGFGFGSPKSFCFFAGTNMDWVMTKGNNGFGYNTVEALMHAGVGFYNFQFTAGKLYEPKIALDGNGEFASVKKEVNAEGLKDQSNNGKLFTLYHKTGVYFSAVFSDVDEFNYTTERPETKTWQLQEFKFNIQPLKQYLPDAAGLPFVDIVKLSPFKKYYNEYSNFYNNGLTNVDSEREPKKKDQYELTLGSDNLLSNGIHCAVTLNRKTGVSFRKAELAYVYYTDKSFVFGSRAMVFMNNTNPKFSFDSFCLISMGENAHLGISYSYNCPDNTTFLPLPELHTIGVQLAFGKRETSKAISSYASAILSQMTK